jgi:predicted small metal-binding protein
MDELFEKATKHSADVHNITEYSDDEMVVIKAAVKHDREC